MKKPNFKKALKYVGIAVVLSSVGGAGAYFGYQAGASEDATAVVAESSDALRNYLEVVEDEDGNIRIKDQELDAANGIGSTRPFTEIIPTTCEAAIKSIKDTMRGKESLEDLGPKVRADFTFTTTVAKDLCSYEEYRNLLVGDLGKFIFSDVASPATDTTAPGGESGAVSESTSDTASDTTASSTPGEK